MSTTTATVTASNKPPVLAQRLSEVTMMSKTEATRYLNDCTDSEVAELGKAETGQQVKAVMDKIANRKLAK